MIIEHREIKYNGKVVFEKIVLTNDFRRMPKIFVEDEACFLFVRKGAFSYRTPTNLMKLHEGNALLSKCGNYFYEQVPSKPEDEIISAVGAYFYPSMVKDFFQTDLSMLDLKNNFDAIRVNVDPLLKSFAESIDYLLDNPELADEGLILNKLKELIILLSKSETSINQLISSMFLPFEYNITEVIQNNIFSNLSLEEFAKLCNCSLATFKRKFERLYNESPAKYILQKKLDYSSQLLQIKNKPITDIAFECGFETLSNFNKAFKNYFGKSPSEYRMS